MLIWIVFYAVRTQNIVLCMKYTSTHVSIHVQSMSCQSLHGQINQHQIVKKSSLNSTLCYRLIDHKSSCNIKSEKQVV